MLRFLPFVLVAAAFLSGAAAAPRCDRLLVGGVVHLGTGATRVEIAVSEGRIVALVASDEAGAWRKAAAEVVDLAGAHVYPGLTEGHGHFIGYGAALEQVDLVGTTSYAEVIERVKQAAAARPAGAWIFGRGWDQNDWADKAFPHHGALSAAVGGHPVLLRRVDGHAVLLNAAALALAGIGATSADPPGGRIVQGRQGRADRRARRCGGGPRRRACSRGRRPPTSSAAPCSPAGPWRLSGSPRSTTPAPPARSWPCFARCSGAEGCRCASTPCSTVATTSLLDAELAAGPSLTRDGMLAVRAVKLYADGALGSRGAWLSAPYSDEPGRGAASR